MAYSYANQYPYQYPTYQYAPQQMPTMQPQSQPNAGFVWVQGEAGAKAYPVAAGNSVLLMDSENPVLYLKSTDATGRPLPMETYDLVKRTALQRPIVPDPQPVTPQVDLSEYVKACELEDKVNALIKKALGE